MTTLNAKANAAYHALIDEYEREHPDGVWMGFDHQRDAYEQGWEDGHEARPVVDRAEEPGIPVEKVRAQHADFLNRATWARRNGQGEAASLWVSAAALLLYLLPEEPTS